MSLFGYKVHFSETCDEDLPHLISHLQTIDATETHVEYTEAIHQALAKQSVLPETHLMDAGLLFASQQFYDVELIGPVSQNNQWQARAAQGYDLASFQIERNAFDACRASQKLWRHLRDFRPPVRGNSDPDSEPGSTCSELSERVLRLALWFTTIMIAAMLVVLFAVS